MNNFRRMRKNIYNLGLSSANLTKKQLALRIKKIKNLKITIKKGKDQIKRLLCKQQKRLKNWDLSQYCLFR